MYFLKKLFKIIIANIKKLNLDEDVRFFEFLVLFRNIEKARYQNNYIKMKNFYHDNCDLVFLKKDNKQELTLSFGKLASLCLENGFFSKEKQREFYKDIDEIVKISK